MTVGISTVEFDFVRTLVRRKSAIVLEPGKEYLVEARLLPLARAKGLPSVSAYVGDVMRGTDPSLNEAVVDALTTNETSWFRDSSPFTALTTQVVPEILASRKDDRVLRVWSAACSSGQEAYSIAMTAEDLARSASWRTEILGTDISDEMLKRARAGRYSQLEINRGLPAPNLVRHFTRVGTDWEISESLRRLCTWRKANLAAPFPSSVPFDIVFLRNVLIYFDTPTKRDILQRVTRVLRPGGYLFLGGAETTLGVDEGWERVVFGRAAAYRPRSVSPAGR